MEQCKKNGYDTDIEKVLELKCKGKKHTGNPG
jgi:hypothetical protein